MRPLTTLRSVACGLALALAAAAPAPAADHADAPLQSGDLIPGTSDTLGAIGSVYTDGAHTLFDGANDKDDPGFGMMKFLDATTFKFQKISWKPTGEASLSDPSFAFLVDDGGVPSIYGVEDVEDWSPVLLVKVGADLPGGFTVSELGPFALGGKKLVVIAKKAGGEAIFGLSDFAGGDPVMLAQTGSVTPDLGDITGFKSVDTNGKKVVFHAVTPEGEGIYLTEDWSANKFNPVASTNTEIPELGVKFGLFRKIEWNGKKVTFEGGDGGNLEGIYYKDDLSKPDAVKTVADTASSWLQDPDVLFTGFEGFSIRSDRLAFVASSNDGTRGAYLDEVGKAKRILADGDELEDGRKVTRFDATQQALGSYVVTSTLNTGTTAVVVAKTSTGVPALRPLALRLLLVAALVAIVLSWRATREGAAA